MTDIEVKSDTPIKYTIDGIEVLFTQDDSTCKVESSTEQLAAMATKITRDYDTIVTELPDIARAALQRPTAIPVTLDNAASLSSTVQLPLNGTAYGQSSYVSYSHHGYWSSQNTSEITHPNRTISFHRSIPSENKAFDHEVLLFTFTERSKTEKTAEAFAKESVHQYIMLKTAHDQVAMHPTITAFLKGPQAGKVIIEAMDYKTALADLDGIIPDLHLAQSIKSHVKEPYANTSNYWSIEFNTPEEKERIVQNLINVAVNGELLAQ